ncbi:MAG: hypothetical protein CVU03_01010 [Bacteroidetes bacterium HGW-Bacteroidetes-2]|jgi:hypothetical protein|nr:MAG: hypothetical protein CVU03_01010 [Bacteroidetes bacterium HGW-Bacteroidetes-2]
MRTILTFICLFIFSWVTAQDNEQIASPVIVTKVGIGQEITFDGITIYFKEVLEDSRCPSGVTCIWAGQAKVVIEVKEKGKLLSQKEIIFGQTKEGEITNKTLFDYGNYRLKAFSIEPYPEYEKITDVTTYTLLVYKEKK